ncbi:hypothetical protein CC78DRAFT_34176 [Lojkania enalia]|uniref:EthD domain-containing protein n=1 Tax=Lojkania enalia TaxID=147567 RepID=A0A9P4N939_9PLEO|nr:hypothetical protein CC78DRAFT_34176 [Didymosphaeria enalia]
MVYTLVLFLSRKPGVSLSDFKTHYETTHVPLLKAIVGEDFPLSYTRHYIDRDDTLPFSPAEVFVGSQEDFAFDALAVLTFASKVHWERFKERIKGDGAQKLKTEDEKLFMDGGAKKGVFCGETRSTGRDGGAVGWRFVGSV